MGAEAAFYLDYDSAFCGGQFDVPCFATNPGKRITSITSVTFDQPGIFEVVSFGAGVGEGRPADLRPGDAAGSH